MFAASICSISFVSDAAWTLDLVANLALQFALVSLLVLLVALAARRRGPALVLLVACVLFALALSLDRVWWAPEGDDWSITPAAPGAVRLLHFNASSRKRAEDILEMIRESGADIVSITEPDWRLQSYVFNGDIIKDLYPYQLERHFNEAELGAGAGFVLSRLPIEEFDPAEIGITMPSEFMAGFVSLPSGRTLGILAMHPRSPRTSARWVTGNLVTEAAASIVDAMRRARPDAAGIVLLADFNSTPAGGRVARLGREGLRPAKPLLRAAGTYPTWLRWPLTVAIDDAMISRDVAVRSWRTGDPLGSDHWPVYIEIHTPAETRPLR